MKTFHTEVNVRGGRRLPSRKFQRLLGRSGITPDELQRLITEVGGDEVRRVMRALGIEPLDIPTK